MRIAVLFDGAGLARLGLEQAGHECTGFELDPAKHHLSKMVGSGNSVLADVRDVDLSGFDAVWASPPCQTRSRGNPVNQPDKKAHNDSLLDFALNLPHKVLWVENVIDRNGNNSWGKLWNAAQFKLVPILDRARIIGGKHRTPPSYCEFAHRFPGVCPSPLASLGYKRYGCTPRKTDGIEYYYGRSPSIREVAYHMGLDIPDGLLKSWFHVPSILDPKDGKPFTWAKWRNTIYEGIGNGVPVYMARAFGEAYSEVKTVNLPMQLDLFEVA